MKKAYKNGLSVCRLGRASKEELEHTAQQIYNIQVGLSGEYGGVLGVVDFPVEAVRRCPTPLAPMCALETPEDLQPDGTFLRPSHADVVNSRFGLSETEENESRGKIYNQILEQGTQLKSEDVEDCGLQDFLPQVAKA